MDINCCDTPTEITYVRIGNRIKIKNGILKILGHKYKLSSTDKPLLERSTIATICPNTLTIEISSIYPESRQEEGLFHEIIEALDYHLELKLDYDKITALGEGLYQIFNDNF